MSIYTHFFRLFGSLISFYCCCMLYSFLCIFFFCHPPNFKYEGKKNPKFRKIFFLLYAELVVVDCNSPKALRVLCVVFFLLLLCTFFRISFFFAWNKKPSTNYCYFTWLVVLFHFSKNVSYRWIATLRRLECNLFFFYLLACVLRFKSFFFVCCLGNFTPNILNFFFFIYFLIIFWRRLQCTVA